MSPKRVMCTRPLLQAWALSIVVVGCGLSAPAEARAADRTPPPVPSYRTELFGKKYRLDDSRDLAAYTRALAAAMEKPKEHRTASRAEARATDADEEVTTRYHVSKKMRSAMQEAHEVAVALSTATGPDREKLLQDLYVMAGAIRASYLHVLPGDMDLFTALSKEGRLRHPPVGLGRSGRATNLAGTGADPGKIDPILPSSYWVKPENVAAKDLYCGFGRTTLPSLEGEVCTYRGPKTGFGVHPGFEVSCGRYKRAKIKFGKQYSQPFAQRIFWALGFHTVPADYVPVVKVKWDPRIFTEFNSRKDERMAIKLAGLIPVHTAHRQRYIDPFEPLSEVIMRDENGREVSVKPNPSWDAFKKQLYKDPRGRPETVEGNFNEAFANRIEYLVYRHVDLQLKDDTEDDDDIYLGNWDWDGEGNPGIRENRASAFVAAWLNDFDPSFDNNKLYMIKPNGEREFKHYIYDVGVSLGRADDAPRMQEQLPNDFPWSFTHPARPGDTAIPLDGSYHPIRENAAYREADIYDARWIAPYLAQLTEAQLLEALVASGLPSAQVRLYYDKLASRRNQALDDLGCHYPPLKLMDASREFDYDPQKDGPITVTTRRNEQVTAPDEDWVVVKGRVYTRAEVQAGAPQRYQAMIAQQQKDADYWRADKAHLHFLPVGFVRQRPGFTIDHLIPMVPSGFPARDYNLYPGLNYSFGNGWEATALVVGAETLDTHKERPFYGLGLQKRLLGEQSPLSRDWVLSVGGYGYLGPHANNGGVGYLAASRRLLGGAPNSPLSLYLHLGGKVETIGGPVSATGVQPFVGGDISFHRRLFLSGEYSPRQSWQTSDMFTVRATVPVVRDFGVSFGIAGTGYTTVGFVGISF
jgi:hypothetical protein